ncbi:MAG: hypothetical protein KAW92_01510 [Candidatus Cloacimonetes bacterium]|nr:hypothetical protein [Candidatus Cloacimonadota bacterium]
MKRFYFVIGLFLLVMSSLSAQMVFVPLENGVYRFLERMEIKGLTNRCFNAMKPIPRTEILLYLLNIKDSENYENLQPYEKKKLEDYLEEYSYERKFLDVPSSPSKSGIKSGIIGDSNLLKALESGLEYTTGKEISLSDKERSEKKWHPLHFPYKFFHKENLLVFNPLFRFKYKNNESDNSFFAENNRRLTGGGEIYGYLGDNIGFYFRGVNNAEWGDSCDVKKLDRQEQGIGILGSIENCNTYDEVDAYVSFSTKYADLIIGRYSNYWGIGKTGSLTISNKPPSYPQIMVKAGFSNWLKFIYFHSWLESNIKDDSLSYGIDWGHNEILERKFFKKKYVAAHRLEISPLKNLKLGFSEMLYYGERDPELVYFIPIMLFWSAQHYTNDQDNLQAGIDIEWIPTRFCKLYGSIMIDEIKLSKMFDKEESRNQLGYQVGSYFVEPFLPGLDFRIEYTHLNPWTYTHKFPINEATSDGYVMGYWTGQNADNLYLGVDYQLNYKLKISLDYSRYRKGAQDSIYYQYHTPPSEKFLFGHQYTKNTFGVSLEYEIMNNLFCELSCEFLDCNVNEANINKEEYVNPVLYKSDFKQNSLVFSVGYGFK